MAFNPITSTEIVNGAPVDTALFGKVKNNFDNHEMRLVNEELDVDLVRAYQIVIDDTAGHYAALNIETALQEVMELALANQDYNVTVFNNFGGRISSLEGRIDTAEDDIDLTSSNLLTLAGRVTATEDVNGTQDTEIDSLKTRTTTAEENITTLQSSATTNAANIARNTSQLSMQIASINKADFTTRLVANTGSPPVYNSAAPCITGVGTMQDTDLAQEITYDTFIPVNALMGAAMALTYSAPVGTSMTFGFKCYTSAQALITSKTIISAQAGTGAFVHSQGHCKAEGVGAENFPVGTRFVKPYIVWTGNTGTINFDFMSVQPLGFSQYALFID
jgi:hypothetical protein